MKLELLKETRQRIVAEIIAMLAFNCAIIVSYGPEEPIWFFIGVGILIIYSIWFFINKIREFLKIHKQIKILTKK